MFIRRPLARTLLASLFLTPALVSANDLLETYRKALDQDTTLAAAKHQRDASVEAKPQALSAFLPQLNAQGSATRSRSRYPRQCCTPT